jgi:Flp pilus assembly secretin CpaC
MRRIFFAAIAMTLAAPSLAAPKQAGIALAMDEVRTLTFARPIATVYVGNPSIADITMIDARHAFLLGKAYGSTNIVALNHDGDQVYDSRVAVVERRNESFTLNRGAQRVTYDCNAGRCEISPTPGDGKDSYDQAMNQLGSHADTARKAAGN